MPHTHELVLVGTFDAAGHLGQAELVRAVLRAGRPTFLVALRGPWNLEALPEAPTSAATYGIQPPHMAALADALLGRIPFLGRLPITLEAHP